MEYQINNKGMGFPSFEESRPSAPLYYEGKLTINGLLIRNIEGLNIPMCYGYSTTHGTIEVLASTIMLAYLKKFGRQPVPAELIGITIRVSRPRKVIERDGKRHIVRGYQIEFL